MCTSVSEILDLYKSLIKLVADTKKNFEITKKEHKRLNSAQQYKKYLYLSKKKRRKVMLDESKDNVELDRRENFQTNTFNIILDKLDVDL